MAVLTIILDALWFSIRTISPLVLFLIFFQLCILRTKIQNLGRIAIGLGVCVIGLALFYKGLEYGLMALGNQVGSTIAMPNKSGLVMTAVFAFILGYGATIAEPALIATAIQAEELTAGALKKNLFIQAVAVGVGIGVLFGILRLVFNWPLIHLLIPPYIVTIVLSFLSSGRTMPIAWDAGGVTTGPITVPLVLALGLGISLGKDGFGILSLASIYPIMTVLAIGVLSKRRGGG
jgi:hypothetical protein